MREWLSRWARWREARTLAKRAIPEPMWQATLERFPFLTRRSMADLARLRELATVFLTRKEFSGAAELQVTDAMAVAIAAQACVPVLELGLQCYDSFVGIVVHADAVGAPREFVDEAGVVHHYIEELSGEAMDRGPLMLVWRDVAEAGESAAWGYNVVIHEFVHVLDMHAARAGIGGAAGMPSWSRRLAAEFDRFVRRVDSGVDTLLDPYGAEAIEEFFAVAAETFFVAPVDFIREEPVLYRLLESFFRQSPAESAMLADRAAIKEQKKGAEAPFPDRR
ncbi:MAG: M90 family metallopeptidase [Caldimonas sp.]